MEARRRLSGAVVCVLAALSGCSGDPEATILSDVLEPIMPPTPGEAARDAFNIYDADVRRRSVALISASPFAGEAPYVRMYRLLMDDPDPTVRAAALAALGRHGGVEDVPIMIQHLTHEASFVRWEAAKALQKIHAPEAVRPLIAALRDDEDLDVRLAAAMALGQYRERAVFDALVGALNDRDFGVRKAAARSLATLTGQDMGTDGTRWLAWADQKPEEAIFADARPYTWQPYVKPRGVFDRMQFWKKPVIPEPRPPIGAEARADEPASAGG